MNPKSPQLSGEAQSRLDVERLAAGYRARERPSMQERREALKRAEARAREVDRASDLTFDLDSTIEEEPRQPRDHRCRRAVEIVKAHRAERESLFEFAARIAPINELRPSLPHRSGWRRRLAEWVGRQVVSLARVLTPQQSAFNHAVLLMLEEVRRSTRESARRMSELPRSVERRLLQESRGDIHRAMVDSRAAELELEADIHELRACVQRIDRDVLALRDELSDVQIANDNDAPSMEPSEASSSWLELLGNGNQTTFPQLFRGASDHIRQRLEIYTRHLPVKLQHLGVLDLGCGGGEWLSLAEELGFRALGVELADEQIALCRSRGLDVRRGDAVTTLESTASGSLAAVSAFHLIEHLDMTDVVRLLRESYRALAPGGVLMLETPNIDNLHVATLSFHLDPSHRQPVPRQLLEYVTRQVGFGRIETGGTSDGGPGGDEGSQVESWIEGGVEPLAWLESRLTADLDYFLIARR